MTTEVITLVENYSTESADSSYTYGVKKPGAGYHKISNNLHTVVFLLDEFKGSIKLQGTLALKPGDNDWFDIVYDNDEVQLESLDSTPLVLTATRNFSGNFVWIRAGYNLIEGTITAIHYNF